jgi:hypothetical protein
MGQGVHMVNVPPGSEATVIHLLQAADSVAYAELDYQHSTAGAAIPNDPAFINQ